MQEQNNYENLKENGVKHFVSFSGSEKEGVDYYKFLIWRSEMEENKKSKMNITRIKRLETKSLF